MLVVTATWKQKMAETPTSEAWKTTQSDLTDGFEEDMQNSECM